MLPKLHTNVFSHVLKYNMSLKTIPKIRLYSSIHASTNSMPTSPFKTPDARLVLQDGSVFTGVSFGSRGTVVGEVVFNTAITGYQEILTDPSYYKQFVCFTHPSVGNTGVNFEDNESQKCWTKGCIVRDYSVRVSNYRSKMDLDSWFKDQGVIGITGIDTRQLTTKLREYGCMNGVLTTDTTLTTEELITMSNKMSIEGVDLVNEVTIENEYNWTTTTEQVWEFSRHTDKICEEDPFHIVAYDFGIKFNILRRLSTHGCRITVVPADTKPEKVLAMKPDGVFFSNGPGDPSSLPYAVEACEAIMGKVPTFGICMGHQIMAQAFGGKIFKLTFGHHGANHPIRHIPTGRIEISSQNHNFAVDQDTLCKEVEVSHINLNDGTCAGISCKEKMAMSVQYHPEASPGPHDADVCFTDFILLLRTEREKNATSRHLNS